MPKIKLWRFLLDQNNVICISWGEGKLSPGTANTTFGANGVDLFGLNTGSESRQ